MMCLCIDLCCVYFVLSNLGCVGLKLSVWNIRVQYFSILFFLSITWCDELNCKPQNTCLLRILECDLIWNKGLWMYNWATISIWSHNKYKVFHKSSKKNSFKGKRATRAKKDKGEGHVKTERDWRNAPPWNGYFLRDSRRNQPWCYLDFRILKSETMTDSDSIVKSH